MHPYDQYRGPGVPSLIRFPVPAGSRMTPLQWAEANDHWQANRLHPHGVAEHFGWGTVLWSTNGRGPLGVVVADPEEPVETAHRVAGEIAATHVRTLGANSRTVSRTAAWSGFAAALPTLTVVSTIDGVAGFTLPAAAAAGVVTAFGVGRRRRMRTQRSSWRHVFDPAGAAACLPHLRWLSDLVEQVPDQARLVWDGVREIIWAAPSLQTAAGPVEQVSVALARTARARRHRDVVALEGLPAPDPDPRVSRIDDIAASVVGALGFEEEAYRTTYDVPEPDPPADPPTDPPRDPPREPA